MIISNLYFKFNLYAYKLHVFLFILIKYTNKIYIFDDANTHTYLIMVKSTSIRINQNTLEKLAKYKEKYSLTSHDEVLFVLINFIEENNINPRQSFSSDFRKNFIDFEIRMNELLEKNKKELIQNFASYRKWMGAIERDYLKKILENSSSNKNVFKDEIQKSTIENPLNSHLIKLDNSKEELEEYKKENSLLKNKINEYKNATNDVLNNHSIYEKGLKKILNNIEIKSGFGSMKITVNLTQEEVEELKLLL